jgi:hypothetical protein
MNPSNERAAPKTMTESGIGRGNPGQDSRSAIVSTALMSPASFASNLVSRLRSISGLEAICGLRRTSGDGREPTKAARLDGERDTVD